jgi:hypothetical protein
MLCRGFSLSAMFCCADAALSSFFAKFSLLTISVRGAEDAAKKAKRRLKRKKEKAGVKKAKTDDKVTGEGLLDSLVLYHQP